MRHGHKVPNGMLLLTRTYSTVPTTPTKSLVRGQPSGSTSEAQWHIAPRKSSDQNPDHPAIQITGRDESEILPTERAARGLHLKHTLPDRNRMPSAMFGATVSRCECEGGRCGHQKGGMLRAYYQFSFIFALPWFWWWRADDFSVTLECGVGQGLRIRWVERDNNYMTFVAYRK